MAENGYAKPVLVTTDWLAEHLNDDNIVVAEVDENPDLYDEGHIAGAVKPHWRDDLQDPVERDLVDKPTFERLLSERGIANDTTLVLYGDKNNWFAAYAYWYLKIYGHGDVRILDGGRQKWADEARDFTTETPQPQQADYRANERDESIRTYRDSVRAQIGEQSKALVDGVGHPRRRADRKGFLAALADDGPRRAEPGSAAASHRRRHRALRGRAIRTVPSGAATPAARQRR